MIDWLTLVAPLDHKQGAGGPFYAGEVLSIVPDHTSDHGEAIEWTSLKRKKLQGSYSTTIMVRSIQTSEGPSIWVSGNPVKWFQGHNIFGSADLPGLVNELLYRVCALVGVTPSPDNIAAWNDGRIRLERVDCTYSWDLQTVHRVRAAIRALDASAHLKHRGRGHYAGDSITYGKGSSRWSLTFYAKGPELLKHPLPHSLLQTSLPALADRLLRCEVRMLSKELIRRGLEWVSAWDDNTAVELHQGILDGLHIAEATMIDAPTLEGLPGRLQLAYQAWKDGHDLRATLPRRTFYRYRAELLAHGVDIAVQQERTGLDHSKAVPLRLVLNAQPSTAPAWAVGTPLYFEPRYRVAA